MTNWTDIHPDFGKYNWLQESWERRHFSYEQVKEWKKSLGEKFKPTDYFFCVWLSYNKGLSPQRINFSNREDLRKEYNNIWKNIHENFDEKLQQEWESRSFNYENCKRWIDIGLEPSEYSYVYWLKIKGYTAEWFSNYDNKQKLLEEYESYRNITICKLCKILKNYFYFRYLNQDEEIKERIKKFGLCIKCNQPNAGYDAWCRVCNSSGNQKIDQFIQKCHLEADNPRQVLFWIPYEHFTDIKQLAKGGFGTVSKAIWIDFEVALKTLDNSRNMTIDFLQEIANHRLFNDTPFNDAIVKCLGISRNPITENYIMVMEYVDGDNLRKTLDNFYNLLDFKTKIKQLYNIAYGLGEIHDKNLVHRDFHSGNILNEYAPFSITLDITECYITDLGLCRPADETSSEKVYGVLPYVAPEVLRNQPYTQASDIYSFGIIAYEILSSLQPYHDIAHDEFLAIKICQGLRPKFQIKIPQPLQDLIEKCWDSDSTKRPTAKVLKEILWNWENEINSGINGWESTEFYQKHKEAEEFNKLKEAEEDAKFIESLFSESEEVINFEAHSQAIYTSRLLNYKNLPKPQNSKEINDMFYHLKESGNLDSLRIMNSGLIKQFDNDWTNIHPNFTPKLQSQWQNLNFTYSQVREWINIHSPAEQSQEIQEPEFYAWLRDEVKLTAEQVLNDNTIDFEALKLEFEQNQMQTQIIHNPPKNS